MSNITNDEPKIKEKIICSNCKLFKTNLGVSAPTPLSCDSCERILFSRHRQGLISTPECNSGSIVLPPKTKFFHLNADLYNGLKLSNQYDYSKKSVLIVGSDWIEHMNAFNSLSYMNFKVKVNLKKSKYYKYWLWANDLFDDFIEAEHRDINEKDVTLSAVQEYMTQNKMKFDAILTIDEDCIQMAAYLANELGCRSIPFHVAQTVQHKHKFREYCQQIGIISPKHSLLKSDERLKRVFDIEQFLSSGIENENLKKCYLTLLANGVPPPFIIKNPIGCAKGTSKLFLRNFLIFTIFFKYF
jgi:hypothetical protein